MGAVQIFLFEDVCQGMRIVSILYFIGFKNEDCILCSMMGVRTTEVWFHHID